MRDIIVVSLVAVIVPFIFRWPHVGILAFAWISLMNPHRLTYGFAYSLPYALMFFAITGLAWFFSKERKMPPVNTLSVLLIFFTIWIGYTTYHAWLPELAFHKFDRTIKIILAAFFVAILLDRKDRIIQMVWVISLSVGFYGLKGGVFTVLTGGDNRVWGPPDSFMADNNALALSLVMVVPLMYFLALETKKPWLRWGVVFTSLMTLGAVLGTYSRGGLLALGGMAGFLWLKSSHKLITIGCAAAVGLFAFNYAPSEWRSRMASIEDYAEDPSVQSRFRSWGFAIDVANDSPVTGGGFQVFALNRVIEKGQETYLNAHSIYFEVLGEHGYVGLILFIAVGACAFLSCSHVIAVSSQSEDLLWAGNLARSIQVSLAGYALGGAFLNMAFFDLLYFILAIVIALAGVVQEGCRTDPSVDAGPRIHSAWNSKAPESMGPDSGRGTARAG